MCDCECVCWGKWAVKIPTTIIKEGVSLPDKKKKKEIKEGVKDPYITEVCTRTGLGARKWAGLMAKGGRASFFDGQLGVHFFLGLEHVPLGDGSPWVGQHVGPVAKLGARAV